MSKQEQKHHIFNINDFIPKRFGLNYNPPQIILEYLTPSTGKLYHHKMRIHKLKKDKPTADIMKELYDRHNQYLDKKKVNPKQIEKLIEKVKANFVDKRKTNKNNNKNGNITEYQKQRTTASYRYRSCYARLHSR
jgi:centrosomal protein CEP19